MGRELLRNSVHSVLIFYKTKTALKKKPVDFF